MTAGMMLEILLPYESWRPLFKTSFTGIDGEVWVGVDMVCSACWLSP